MVVLNPHLENNQDCMKTVKVMTSKFLVRESNLFVMFLGSSITYIRSECKGAG